jgi:hypothetical protein
VPAQIERGELDIANSKFLRGRVQRGLQHGDAVVLQHVQQRRLACVVEAEEQQLGVLVREAQVGQDLPDCVCMVSAYVRWMGEADSCTPEILADKKTSA